jgi:hypothetical protein
MHCFTSSFAIGPVFAGAPVPQPLQVDHTPGRPGLVLGYAAQPPDQLRAAAVRIARAAGSTRQLAYT